MVEKLGQTVQAKSKNQEGSLQKDFKDFSATLPSQDTFLQVAYIDQLIQVVTNRFNKIQNQKQVVQGNLVMLQNEKRALDVIKIYIQRTAISKQPFNLEDVLLQVGQELIEIADSNNCVFAMKISSMPQYVIGNSELLILLLSSLGQIAIKNQFKSKVKFKIIAESKGKQIKLHIQTKFTRGFLLCNDFKYTQNPSKHVQNTHKLKNFIEKFGSCFLALGLSVQLQDGEISKISQTQNSIRYNVYIDLDVSQESTKYSQKNKLVHDNSTNRVKKESPLDSSESSEDSEVGSDEEQ